MAEISKEVHPMLLQYECDECGGRGKMVRVEGSNALDQEPPFAHKCSFCGELADFDKSYPTIDFAEKE